MRGLRASIRASQLVGGAPRVAACRATAAAPMISRRRIVRSPIFEVAPSFCLPPDDFCKGVSPTQAAKSQPFLKVSAGGARAAMAVAVIGPMPGMLISRRATSSSRARRAISLSSNEIVSSKVVTV